MYKAKFQLIVCVTMSTLLFACGGSGASGAGSQSNVDQGSVPTSEQEPRVEMANVIASDDFDFTNKLQVQVDLDLNEQLQEFGAIGQRAYVSVYGNFQEFDSGGYYALASSRILAGALNNGFFKQSFTEHNVQSEYLIEVWFYNGEPPLQQLVSLQENRLIW